MKLRIDWKKIIIRALDVVLAGYLVMAITSWNSPDKSRRICTKVNINISDSNNAGFLSAGEIKRILEKDGLYPLDRNLNTVSPRRIEEVLKSGPFVRTAECYVTENGHVDIIITQRMPIIRIKSNQGGDYYLDDNGGILPNSKYTSDLIIATGNINRWFAHYGIAPLARAINSSEFWSNQIEQIHVLPDRGIELVPRVGEHIIYLGYLPTCRNKAVNNRNIIVSTDRKLSRLEKFYRYGLSQAGWNKYSYISVEFDNQIICKRNNAEEEREKEEPTVEKKKPEKLPEETPAEQLTE